MKDSVGSTFLIGIMMVFVVIFVSFTAVIANIAKTFRMKNQVINYVEQYKYDGSAGHEAISKIEDYLGTVDYEIEQKGSEGSHFYKVTVYATIELPFFDINMSLPISGESKIVASLD